MIVIVQPFYNSARLSVSFYQELKKNRKQPNKGGHHVGIQRRESNVRSA